MKKILFFVFILCLSISLYAQSNNDIRRFVGTWRADINVGNVPITLIYIFNNDGSGSFTVSNRNNQQRYQIQYFLVESKIIINATDLGTDICDYYFSPNGNVLVLGGMAIIGTNLSIWLNKQ